MPKLVPIERELHQVGYKLTAWVRSWKKAGLAAKGVAFNVQEARGSATNGRAPMDSQQRRRCAPVRHRDQGGEHGAALLGYHRLAGRSGLLAEARRQRDGILAGGDEEKKITYQGTPSCSRSPSSAAPVVGAPSTAGAQHIVQNVECRKPWHSRSRRSSTSTTTG